MELLQKFAAVEIQADNRITESDKWYCEQHQKAYEAALNSYKELAFFWDDMNTVQQELLGEPISVTASGGDISCITNVRDTLQAELQSR